MSHTVTYDLNNEIIDPDSLTYFFISQGKNGQADIFKIIQFAYVRFFDNKRTYNFGFGDYDINSGEINDEAVTDNGDAYKIFNTVLSTIPIFFEKFPDAAVLVTGSDGRHDFEARCRIVCRRNCRDICRNFNRRIRLYCQYVSREFKSLTTDYQFIGGIKNNEHWYQFFEFQPGQLYVCTMKHEADKSTDLVKVPKTGFLTLIASHLKGKILFPKKMEEAKKILDNAKLIKE